VAFLYDIRCKCQLNLSVREQPLLTAQDVVGMGWVTKRPGVLRPNILQLNTDGLTADKISAIEQLAYKNKAFIIVLQKTHCTNADKLVIPNFSVAAWVSPEQEPRPCHVCP